MQIGQGRGQTRGVQVFFLAVCLGRVSVFGACMHLVSEWMTEVLGVVRLHRPQRCNRCSNHGLATFLLGSYSGLVKRVTGVGGGARSARTFFFIFVTPGNRKESSQTLDFAAIVCQSRTSFSRHRGFAASG